MYNRNIYTIPFQDKYIIYQPLNKFAFIGNSAMISLIEDILNNKKIDNFNNKDVLEFLNSYGFFNQHIIDEKQHKSSDYKPVVCVLCMTSACNFRCSYCFANGGETKPTEIELNTGKKAIDIVHKNARELQAEQFVVSFHGGGEPSLPFEKLKTFTAYARDKDLECAVELTSNGYWDEEKTDWVISNIDNLTLSFDGLEEVQNKQRPLANGGKTFDLVMKNIRKLDKNDVRYGIRLTVTNERITNLAQSIEFLCKKTSCTTFQVEPAFGAGRAITNNQTIENNEMFVKHFLKAHEIASENGRQFYYSGARPWVLTERFCTAHDNALVVTPDGLLSSCYEISGSDHPLAKAFHFGEIGTNGDLNIDSDIRKNFQNKIKERKELCKECFCYWHCAGDCPAKTFLPESFDNNTFSERCQVNREITKELLFQYLSDSEGIYKEN